VALGKVDTLEDLSSPTALLSRFSTPPPTQTNRNPLQITTRTLKEPDFKFELLPLHSPLLGQSLLVSFPPLIDMLKFSGYPYLIRGQRRGASANIKTELPYLLGSIDPCPTAVHTEPFPTSVLTQSQSFSRSYGSVLPTSLAYIVPLARGCSPWRPAAVMSTTSCKGNCFPWIFKDRQECTGHGKNCHALPAAEPYRQLN